MMDKNRKTILCSVLAVCLICGCAGGFVFGRYWTDNRMPGFSREYVLFVYPDTDVDAVIDSLYCGAGTIRPKSLIRCFNKEDVPERMKAGRYVIKPEHPAVYVARMLTHGWQTPGRLTLSGTLRTKARIASLIGRQMMVDSASVAKALDDDEFLSKYGFSSEDVFGLIIPDSYEMYWTAGIDEIFDRFDREYDAFWTGERKEKASNIGLSQKQVSIMASIVNGESLKEFEYPRIAGVYMNRYRIGMKLQADPTICFIYDYKLDRVLRKHLEAESPYNTYKYAGLPPAPINAPSKACLDAVLNYEHHNYLYFCADASFNGTHKFAVTYDEHLRNAREFQRALTERRKGRK